MVQVGVVVKVELLVQVNICVKEDGRCTEADVSTSPRFFILSCAVFH